MTADGMAFCGGGFACAYVARAFQPEIWPVRLGYAGIAALVRVLCRLLDSREAAKPRSREVEHKVSDR